MVQLSGDSKSGKALQLLDLKGKGRGGESKGIEYSCVERVPDE